MNAVQEYALLFVAVAPVATIAVTNLILMLAGERGTLLFPDRRPLATGTVAVRAAGNPAPAPTPARESANAAAANDEVARQAA
jgi:hypothetical protein